MDICIGIIAAAWVVYLLMGLADGAAEQNEAKTKSHADHTVTTVSRVEK